MPERVLLVDDNEGVRIACERHLASTGFDVRTAPSFRIALARLAGGAIDAVIADVSLTNGGEEGLVLAAQVRARFGSQPVVVLTSYGLPAHATAAARLDVDAFLHKPPSLPWLGGLLRARIAERRRGHVTSARARLRVG